MITRPDKDHPAWKLAQTIVTVIGIVVLVIHGHDSASFDAADAGGALSVGLGAKLLMQWMNRE